MHVHLREHQGTGLLGAFQVRSDVCSPSSDHNEIIRGGLFNNRGIFHLFSWMHFAIFDIEAVSQEMVDFEAFQIGRDVQQREHG